MRLTSCAQVLRGSSCVSPCLGTENTLRICWASLPVFTSCFSDSQLVTEYPSGTTNYYKESEKLYVYQTLSIDWVIKWLAWRFILSKWRCLSISELKIHLKVFLNVCYHFVLKKCLLNQWILKAQYRWPLNNMGLNCVGPLMHGFFSVCMYSTIYVFSLTYDFFEIQNMC